jgi:hypothetical protein
MVSKSRISPTVTSVLAQRVVQRRDEARGVRADLALRHRAEVVLEHELDRVLDRHDVHEAGVRDEAQDRGQGRGLPRSRGPRDQDQPLGQLRELRQDGRQLPFLEGGKLVRHAPEHRGQRAPLVEHRRPEARDAEDAVAEVDRELLVEDLLAALAEQREEQLADLLRVQRLGAQRKELPLHPYERRPHRLQVEVGGLLLNGEVEEVVDRRRDAGAGVEGAFGRRGGSRFHVLGNMRREPGRVKSSEIDALLPAAL